MLRTYKSHAVGFSMPHDHPRLISGFAFVMVVVEQVEGHWELLYIQHDLVCFKVLCEPCVSLGTPAMDVEFRPFPRSWP